MVFTSPQDTNEPTQELTILNSEQNLKNPHVKGLGSESQFQKSINDSDDVLVNVTNQPSNDNGAIGLSGSSLYLCGYSGKMAFLTMNDEKFSYT